MKRMDQPEEKSEHTHREGDGEKRDDRRGGGKQEEGCGTVVLNGSMMSQDDTHDMGQRSMIRACSLETGWAKGSSKGAWGCWAGNGGWSRNGREGKYREAVAATPGSATGLSAPHRDDEGTGRRLSSTRCGASGYVLQGLDSWAAVLEPLAEAPCVTMFRQCAKRRRRCSGGRQGPAKLVLGRDLGRRLRRESETVVSQSCVWHFAKRQKRWMRWDPATLGGVGPVQRPSGV